MPLGTEVGLRPCDFVLDGDPAHPSPKRGRSPQFSAHVYCGQTDGWIKTALGMEMGVGPGDIVRWYTCSPAEKRHSPPVFGPCLLWANGYMDQDATWSKGRSRPMPHCVRRAPSLPPKGAQQPRPSFRPMSIVATVAHVSYSAELLFICGSTSRFWFL